MECTTFGLPECIQHHPAALDVEEADGRGCHLLLLLDRSSPPSVTDHSAWGFQTPPQRSYPMKSGRTLVPHKVLCYAPFTRVYTSVCRRGAEGLLQVKFSDDMSLHYELRPSGRRFRVPKSNTVRTKQSHFCSSVNSISEQINLFKRQSSVCACVCVCVRARARACVCVCSTHYESHCTEPLHLPLQSAQRERERERERLERERERERESAPSSPSNWNSYDANKQQTVPTETTRYPAGPRGQPYIHRLCHASRQYTPVTRQ